MRGELDCCARERSEVSPLRPRDSHARAAVPNAVPPLLSARDVSSPSAAVVIWLLAKVLVHVGLAIMSAIRPISERERLIAVWPPASPLSAWMERVWFAPLGRHDVEYYARIATAGYGIGDGTRQFHPLFPTLARPFVWLGVDPLVGLTLLGCLTALLLVFAYYWFACRRLSTDEGQFAGLSFVISPFALALVLPYSEGLFLLCAVMCLRWAKDGRWAEAGIAGAMATLTRQQGLFLTLPLLWIAWERSRASANAQGRHRVRLVDLESIAWLSVLAAPAAYAGWVFYRAITFGDLQLGPATFHDLVYSVLISPAATEVVPIQTFLWPWEALARAWTKLVTAPDLDIVTNMVGGTWFLGLLVAAWRHLDGSERIYSVAITLVSFSYHTGPFHPYMGLLRHLLLAFPVFLGASLCIRSSAARVGYVGLNATGLFALVMFYGLHIWIP